MLQSRFVLCLGLAVASLGPLAACGGKVLVDDPISGGSDPGTSISTAPAESCTALRNNLGLLVSAAANCSPYVNTPQCTGTAVVQDECGCKVLANEGNTTNIQHAGEAYALWVALGCSVTCAPCANAGISGYCETGSSQCAWLYGD